MTFLQRPEWRGFTVDAVIRNDGSVPLYVRWCNAQAQREMRGQWATVWSEACGSGLEGPLVLLPGDSLLRDVAIGGSTRPGHGLAIDPRIEGGKYRLEFFLSLNLDRNGLYLVDVPPLWQRVTNPFIVKEP